MYFTFGSASIIFYLYNKYKDNIHTFTLKRNFINSINENTFIHNLYTYLLCKSIFSKVHPYMG